MRRIPPQVLSVDERNYVGNHDWVPWLVYVLELHTPPFRAFIDIELLIILDLYNNLQLK